MPQRRSLTFAQLRAGQQVYLSDDYSGPHLVTDSVGPADVDWGPIYQVRTIVRLKDGRLRHVSELDGTEYSVLRFYAGAPPAKP